LAFFSPTINAYRRIQPDSLAPTNANCKRFEIERHRAWVSDWEIAEYLHHL
jgi:glutamine synthetase